MNYSLFLARHLSLSSENRKNSPAIRVSIAAVALSLSVMLAAIAIVIGFKREIREKVIGFNSHITLYALNDGSAEDNLITLTPSLKAVLDEQDYITDYSLEASVPAIIKTPDDFKGIYLRSLDKGLVSSFLGSNVVDGKIPDFSDPSNKEAIVISSNVADKLNLKVGDRIEVYFLTGDLKVKKLEIKAIFNSHFDSYDSVLAYGALSLIQDIGGVSPSQGTSIRIHTDSFEDIPYYGSVLEKSLVSAVSEGRIYRMYRVDNALRQGEGYFNWLSLLDTNVVVILILMTVVAVATLISGMLILILDKKRFIGIVRAMGAKTGGVRRVFVYLALKVAIYGMLIGNILMIGFLWCQDRWHFLPLDADAYYIDFVPVDLNWWNILILNVATFVIIYLSLIIPSRFVSRISPAEAMRSDME